MSGQEEIPPPQEASGLHRLCDGIKHKRYEGAKEMCKDPFNEILALDQILLKYVFLAESCASMMRAF